MSVFMTKMRSKKGWLTDSLLLCLVFVLFYAVLRIGH